MSGLFDNDEAYMQAIVKKRRKLVRNKSGQFCTEEELMVEKTQRENAILKRNCEKYYHNWMAVKKVITIEIDEKGMNVYYQENDQPRKHWKDCDGEENVVINAAGRVLQQCTNFTAAFYKSGLAAELEEFADMLGVKKKHPKKKNDEKGKS